MRVDPNNRRIMSYPRTLLIVRIAGYNDEVDRKIPMRAADVPCVCEVRKILIGHVTNDDCSRRIEVAFSAVSRH